MHPIPRIVLSLGLIFSCLWAYGDQTVSKVYKPGEIEALLDCTEFPGKPPQRDTFYRTKFKAFSSLGIAVSVLGDPEFLKRNQWKHLSGPTQVDGAYETDHGKWLMRTSISSSSPYLMQVALPYAVKAGGVSSQKLVVSPTGISLLVPKEKARSLALALKLKTYIDEGDDFYARQERWSNSVRRGEAYSIEKVIQSVSYSELQPGYALLSCSYPLPQE